MAAPESRSVPLTPRNACQVILEAEGRPSRMNETKTSSVGPGEWAQLAGANRFREAERVPAVQLDVLSNQR